MALKDELRIDPYNLDQEWLKQPLLAYDAGERLANAIYERDKKKDVLELIVAECDADIRADPAKYGFESDKKLTEKAIEKTITALEDYEKAQSDVLDANRTVAILTALKTAVDHKKSALEALVRLSAANYYADPKISGEDKKAYEKHSQRQASDALNEDLEGSERLVRRRKRNINGDADSD